MYFTTYSMRLHSRRTSSSLIVAVIRIGDVTYSYTPHSYGIGIATNANILPTTAIILGVSLLKMEVTHYVT